MNHSVSSARIAAHPMPVPSRGRRGRAASWVVLAVGLAYAATFLLASFIPAEWIAGKLQGFAGNGDPIDEILARHGEIVARARWAAGALLLGWAVLLLRRHRLAAALDGPADAVADAMRELPGRVAAFARAALRGEALTTAALLATLAAGIMLRLHYVDRLMRHDEAWTFQLYARMPFYLIPVRYTDVNHHVLNSLLIHVSTVLFGAAPPAVRLPALLFGIATIPVGYGLARAVAGRSAAIVAAALIATAVPLIEFSVNARGYAALALFFLAMLWAGWSAIEGGRRSRWALVALFGTLGIYTIPTMLVPAIAAFTWFALLALAGPPSARLRGLVGVVTAGCATVAGAVLLYLPILVANGWTVLTTSPGIKATKTVAAAFERLPTWVPQLLDLWGGTYARPLGWALLLLVPAAAALAPRNRRPLLLLLLAMAAAVAVQLVVLKDIGPFRIWLPFLPAFLIVAASSVAGLAERVLQGAGGPPALGSAVAPAVALFLCAWTSYSVLAGNRVITSNETELFPEAPAAARLMDDLAAGDVAGLNGSFSDEIAYYAGRAGVELVPIRTENPLRYFRRVLPRTETVPPRPRRLYLVLDKSILGCDGIGCLGVVSPTYAVGQDAESLYEDARYVFLRVPLLAGPS